MGWAINFVLFGISDVTLLDPTLRSDVFDEPEWKNITAVKGVADAIRTKELTLNRKSQVISIFNVTIRRK
jgi:hypothetical protein